MARQFKNYLFCYESSETELLIDHTFDREVFDELQHITQGKILFNSATQIIGIRLSTEIYKLLSQVITEIIIKSDIKNKSMLESLVTIEKEIQSLIKNKLTINTNILKEYKITSTMIRELVLHSNIEFLEIPEN